MEKVTICGQEFTKVSPTEWEQKKGSLKMEYDKVMGDIHVKNWGFVILDQYGAPVDDEFLFEDFDKLANK